MIGDPVSTLSRPRHEPDATIREFVATHALVPDPAEACYAPLAGGVSSDIWLVAAQGCGVVVKRPLADLKVAGEWRAPLARSRSEAAWLSTVSALVPGTCPKVLAFDADQSLIALEYLDPSRYTVWKADLLSGRVTLNVAEAVGRRLGRIHQLTAARPALARQFATDDLFRVLRIEPYLEQVTQHHPALRGPVQRLARETMTTRLALVHGDVSPKNILVGTDGPLILDAECAWWGDPAFDLAFCLNHLLLKCLLPHTSTIDLLQSFDALVTAYLPFVDWEDPDALNARAARLLPALMLARVDGRSPVEYLAAPDRETVRRFTMPMLHQPPSRLCAVRAAWQGIFA